MNGTRAADEQACARLMLRIGYLADRHDVDSFVALFAPEGEIVRPGGAGAKGHDAIRAAAAARPRERVTRHLLTPAMITILGPDEAEGLCYFTMFDGMEAERDAAGEIALGVPVVIGEYQQTYRRIDGEWRIASHRVIPVLRPREGNSA